MRRILKQTTNASNLKATLWSTALAPDLGVLRLLQHRWQLWVTNLHTFTQALHTAVYGSEIWQCLPLPKHPKEGEKTVQRKKKKTKCKLICLAEPHWILSWIQRISVPVIHKYINQVITIGTVIKLQTVLKVQKACGANRHDDSRAREEGDIKIRNWKKNSKCLPSFTLDYCFTAENSTQTSELPAQDFKHTTIFPLRETTTAPNKAL